MPTVHVQYRSDARYKKYVFVFACDRIRLHVNVFSLRASLCANTFSKTCMHQRIYRCRGVNTFMNTLNHGSYSTYTVYLYRLNLGNGKSHGRQTLGKDDKP